MTCLNLRRSGAVAAGLTALAAFVNVALATNSWGGYHWARTTSQFTLKLGNNLSTDWQQHLGGASSDWNSPQTFGATSTPLMTAIVVGQSNKRCSMVAGTTQVCNGTYGNNGWLGLASINVTGGVHITQGSAKMNDTYFNTATYNTPAWRNLVMCQEVGHTLGLDHQDTTFDNPNLGTCMDYTNDPSTNQYPNKHDYDELVIIYTHLDSSNTVGQAVNLLGAVGDFNSRAEWGRLVRASANGRNEVYELDFGNGNKIYTFVIWALEGDSHRR